MWKLFAMLIGAGVFLCVPGARAQNLDRNAVVATPTELFQLNRQLRESRFGENGSLDDARLLEAEASRTGTTVNELLNRRLRIEPVTDAEVLQVFRRIRERQPGVTYKQMLPILRTYLQGQHRAGARAKFIEELKQQQAAR